MLAGTMATRFDYVIIGSGIAGLFAALHAKDHGTVLVLTKGGIHDTNTLFAQGGIAAAVGDDDSPLLHAEDTLRAAAGLADLSAVSTLTTEGPQRVAELMRMGVAFDEVEGQTALALEGAHSRPRVLHAGGDATGAHMETTLAQLARTSSVEVLEYALVTAIRCDASGRAVGVDVLDAEKHIAVRFEAGAVVLASGGAGQLFRATTNPEVATGDGVALAFRAGAELTGMEFYQFHPTALSLPGAPHFLISEAVRGEGAVLRNLVGEAFMAGYHAQADLAPRDVVSRAIVSEMTRESTDHVMLDATHLPADRITTRFPTIYQTCLEHGVDMTAEPIPVTPAAHYMMGGVRTNLWGETTVPGLYACGEVSFTGVHGANRLASNSLLETVVFARRVVERTLGAAPEEGPPGPSADVIRLRPIAAAGAPVISRDALQRLMWEQVGIVRDGLGLAEAAHVLSTWATQQPYPGDRGSQELANMALVGWLMAEAAGRRTESRGAHYRADFPEPSEAWLRQIALAMGDQAQTL
jgi:L-aspartate oxidase